MKSTSIHLLTQLWDSAKTLASLRQWTVQNLTAAALLEYLTSKESVQWEAYEYLGDYRESIYKKAGSKKLTVEHKTNLYFDEKLKDKLEDHCKIRLLPLGGVVAAALLRFSKLSRSNQTAAYQKLASFRKRLLDT